MGGIATGVYYELAFDICLLGRILYPRALGRMPADKGMTWNVNRHGLGA